MRHAENIGDDELADIPDNVAGTFTLGGFEMGPTDQNSTKKGHQVALKLECSQIRPLLDVLAPLTWLGLASAMPNSIGKLPSLQDLRFHSTSTMSNAEHVVFTGGRGKMALNVWTSHPDATLLKIFNYAAKGMQIAAPVIPLPAISIPAASVMTQVIGRLYDKPAFILNQGLTDVVASRDALGDPDLPPNYLRLIAGDYVLIQKPHAEEFGKVMDRLTVLQGYVVEKDKHTELPVEQRAQLARKEMFPDVTYAVLKIGVTQAVAAPPVAPPKPSAGSSGGGSKPAGKPSAESKSGEHKPAPGARPAGGQATGTKKPPQ